MLDHLIVHIGGHKTGTSAIQLTLASNRAALEKRQILYPDIGIVLHAQHRLCEWLAAPANHADDLARLQGAAAACSTLLLSSENFSRLDEVAITTLRQAIPAARHTIVCYIRSPITTIPGWWQELVKHGSTQTLIDYFCDCITRPLQHHIMDPAGILDRWAGVFGADSIVPFIYERCGDLPTHFFTTLLPDVRYEPVPAAQSLNKRLSFGANEFLRVGNLHGRRFVNHLRQADVQRMIRLVEDGTAGSIRRKPLSMDDHGFRWLEGRLAKHWGDRLGNAGQGQLFPDRGGALEYVDGDCYLRSPELATKLTEFCESFTAGSG